MGSQFIKIIASRKGKLFRKLYLISPPFNLSPIYLLTRHYLFFYFKSEEEKRQEIFKCFTFIRLFSHEKNEKSFGQTTVLIGAIVVKASSGRLKFIVCEMLSVVLPQNSVHQTAFTAYVKSGDTLKVTQQIQLFQLFRA